MLNTIRNYVFIPSGEAVRGAEVTVVTAVITTAADRDLSTITDWRVWALGLAFAGANAFLGYAKGKLPPTEN